MQEFETKSIADQMPIRREPYNCYDPAVADAEQASSTAGRVLVTRSAYYKRALVNPAAPTGRVHRMRTYSRP
jgi:hypothetical protein